MSSSTSDVSEKIDIVLPGHGLLYQEEAVDYVLCKPKLMPLKSVTLEKLERMQKDAEFKLSAMSEGAVPADQES